jgi:hypothetical protein
MSSEGGCNDNTSANNIPPKRDVLEQQTTAE